MGTKKFYIVALISFFDNRIKQFEIRAFNPYDAIKNAMLEFAGEKYKQEEMDFQNSDKYPKTIEEFEEHFANCDMDYSVIEVESFKLKSN